MSETRNDRIMNSLLGCSDVVRRALTVPKWKDGIDIEEPSHDALHIFNHYGAALEAQVSALQEEQRKVSCTYGDLSQQYPILADCIEGHEWDNMNISEQRDWALNQASGHKSERFKDVLESSRQIGAWTERALKAEAQVAAITENSLKRVMELNAAQERERVLRDALEVAINCLAWTTTIVRYAPPNRHAVEVIIELARAALAAQVKEGE